MARELVGIAYFPGDENHSNSIYVRKCNMTEFARTAVGKPLNRHHPKEGEQMDSNEIGRITNAYLDDQNEGALVVRAKLHNTPAAFLALREVKEKRLPHFSASVSYDDDYVNTTSGHVVEEVSCVERGDMEEGVNFATSIFDPSEESDETFLTERSRLVQLLRNRSERHDTSEQQPNNTSPHPLDEDDDKMADNAAKEVKDILTPEQFDKIRASILKESQRLGKESTSETDAKIEKLEAENKRLVEAQARLEKDLGEERAFKQKQLDESMRMYKQSITDTFANILSDIEKARKAEGEEGDAGEEESLGALDTNGRKATELMRQSNLDREQFNRFAEQLFSKRQDTGTYSPKQLETGRVVAVAAAATERSMSQRNQMRRVLRTATLENEKLRGEVKELTGRISSFEKSVHEREGFQSQLPPPKRQKRTASGDHPVPSSSSQAGDDLPSSRLTWQEQINCTPWAMSARKVKAPPSSEVKYADPDDWFG